MLEFWVLVLLILGPLILIGANSARALKYIFSYTVCSGKVNVFLFKYIPTGTVDVCSILKIRYNNDTPFPEENQAISSNLKGIQHAGRHIVFTQKVGGGLSMFPNLMYTSRFFPRNPEKLLREILLERQRCR